LPTPSPCSLTDAPEILLSVAQTMQHTRYPNVFGIGDCTNVPTSKTAAAAAAQFLVLRDNLDALMAGGAPGASRYDGYSSCPLVTKQGACMMMEFGYGGKIMETFTPFGIVDQSKEEFLMWLVGGSWCCWGWGFRARAHGPVGLWVAHVGIECGGRGRAPQASKSMGDTRHAPHPRLSPPRRRSRRTRCLGPTGTL
jgi:hypothetical protein